MSSVDYGTSNAVDPSSLEKMCLGSVDNFISNGVVEVETLAFVCKYALHTSRIKDDIKKRSREAQKTASASGGEEDNLWNCAAGLLTNNDLAFAVW
jgi:hypothetical protein